MAMTVVDKDCTEKAECFVNTVAEANYERGYKDGYANAIDEFLERLCTVCCGESMGVIFGNRVKADMLTVDGVCEIAYEIAEAMKGE